MSSIVVLCSHGGDRFDHVMGNIQTLFYAKTMTSLPVYLVTNASVELLLSKVCGDVLMGREGVAFYILV